jgi:hypothetical protein
MDPKARLFASILHARSSSHVDLTFLSTQTFAVHLHFALEWTGIRFRRVTG